MKRYITYEEPYAGQVFDEFGMKRIYVTDVDKKEYPHFDGWIWDMLRSGVFEEVKEEEQEEVETDMRYYVSSVEGSRAVINAEWWFNSKEEALAFRDELRREILKGDHDDDWNLFDGMDLNEIEKMDHRAKLVVAVDAYSYRGGKYGKRIN